MAIRTFPGDIHKDTNVVGWNTYLSNGQGCGTVWFPSVVHARHILILNGCNRDAISGYKSGLCHLCSGHDAVRNKLHWVCKGWKEAVARGWIVPNITGYNIGHVIAAQVTLEPMYCIFCGYVGIEYNQGVNDAHCPNCGLWQLEELERRSQPDAPNNS